MKGIKWLLLGLLVSAVWAVGGGGEGAGDDGTARPGRPAAY